MLTPAIDRETGAEFSPCRLYRYTLWRRWGAGKTINFICLNPSTADETENDATVERCERRAKAMGFDCLVVTNIFAWRSTAPAALRRVAEPKGQHNDLFILTRALSADMVVCAWGGNEIARGRQVEAMLRDAGVKLHALKVSLNNGSPWHPLYVGYKVLPKVWERAG
jgi:hypothetical protein